MVNLNEIQYGKIYKSIEKVIHKPGTYDDMMEEYIVPVRIGDIEGSIEIYKIYEGRHVTYGLKWFLASYERVD